MEAGRAYGMSSAQLYRRIIFPVALRNVLPGYGNELALMVKSTSLVSTITLMDVSGVAARLIADSFRPVEILAVAGAIYFAINLILTRTVAALDWKLTHHMRVPELAGSRTPVRRAPLPGPAASGSVFASGISESGPGIAGSEGLRFRRPNLPVLGKQDRHLPRDPEPAQNDDEDRG